MLQGINLGLRLSLLTIAILFLLAVKAPWIAPHDPENAQPQLRLKDPGGSIPWARTIWAAAYSAA
jgi:hypothetical protein